MKMTRIISMILALVLTVSLFAGCSDKAAKPAAEKKDDTATTTPDVEEVEDVVVNLGIWPEDSMTDEIALHEGYRDAFNASHPNVEIVPAYYKYATDTFVPLAESGNLPTIFDTWYTEPQKIINNGFARDITDILEERGWLDAINPSIRELLSDADGKVYGIPRDGYALGLMCNVNLFEQAGLANDDGSIDYPKTWEELAETAKKIKDETGAAGLCLLAKDNGGGWHFSNIAWAFGADLTKDNGDGTFTSNLNTPEAIAAMEYVKSLKWEYDVLTSDPTNEDWGTGFTALGTDGAAMYIGANDAVMQPTYANGLPADKLALIPIPAGPGGQYSLFGGTPYMFSPTATDAEVNAALDYLIVMGKAPVMSEEALEGMVADAEYRVANGIPVIKRFPAWTNQELIDAENKIAEEFSNTNPLLFDAYFEATTKDGNLRNEEPGLTQDMYAELTKVLQAVLTDKNADVATLMETANSNYQQILDTNA